MSLPARFATGDTIPVGATITSGGVVDALPGDTILAALVDAKGVRAAGTSDAVGTLIDAATGLVSATFPAASTASIVPGRYLVEWQITRGGLPATFRTDVYIDIFAGVIP